MFHKILLLVVVTVFSSTRYVTSQQRPFGFASGATGGGNTPPASPGDIKTLRAWLADDKPRVILIEKMYDFTDSEGNTTGPGCSVWPKCTNGRMVQVAINFQGWCSKQAGSKSMTVNYRKAAINPLLVKSNKSILGRGPNAGIKGKGLSIKNAQNIIIRGITLTYLNPQAVWGGDALLLNNARNVWIDHCRFSLIGRQMLVSQSKGNVGITLSNNWFDGKTPWSFDCSDRHHWTIFLAGDGDQITMANNCFSNVSGRTPKVGNGGVKETIHIYNSYYSASRGQIMDVSGSGTVLMEGNVFQDVLADSPKQSQTSSQGGKVFAAFNPSEASPCPGTLGRPCVLNQMLSGVGRGGAIQFGKDTSVLRAGRSFPAMAKAQVVPPADVLARKFGNCGLNGYK